jgi:hypothetical protein
MGSHLSGKLRQAASENTKLIKDLVLEDMDIMPEKKGAGDLLGMIIKKKKLTAKSASKELGVRESKVKLWALRLKSRGLIDVNENERFEMTKK